MKKRLLFISGRLPSPFFIGGSELSIETMLIGLSRTYDCTYLGTQDPYININLSREDLSRKLSQLSIKYQTEKDESLVNKLFEAFGLKKRTRWTIRFKKPYSKIIVNRRDFIPKIKQTITEVKPDLIITQLDGAEAVLTITQQLRIPTILFVRDAEDLNIPRIQKANESKQNVILFNSEFTQKHFAPYTKIRTAVCHPFVDQSRYDLKQKKRSPQYITMINPVAHKGGRIFEKIVQKMPDTQFLAVKNWYDPSQDRIYLDKYPNVTLWERQLDMQKVYAHTKLLLIPSTWQESFPRVALEAGTNGIPVIASQVGGIPETIGPGGKLIKDFTNVDKWVKTINSINDDPKLYAWLSKTIRQHVKTFSHVNTMKKIERIVKEMVRS